MMTLEYIPIRDFSKRLAEGWKLACELKPGDWAAVMEAPAEPIFKLRHGSRCKLADEDVSAIRQSKESNSRLSKKYGIAASRVSQIRNGLAYKWVEPA